MTDGPSDEVKEQARVISALADSAEPEAVAAILTPWLQAEPRKAAEVIVALALLADRDKALKEAHAAYARGVRTPTTIAMERKYQNNRKRKLREYEAHTSFDAPEEVA